MGRWGGRDNPHKVGKDGGPGSGKPGGGGGSKYSPEFRAKFAKQVAAERAPHQPHGLNSSAGERAARTDYADRVHQAETQRLRSK